MANTTLGESPTQAEEQKTKNDFWEFGGRVGNAIYASNYTPEQIAKIQRAAEQVKRVMAENPAAVAKIGKELMDRYDSEPDKNNLSTGFQQRIEQIKQSVFSNDFSFLKQDTSLDCGRVLAGAAQYYKDNKDGSWTLKPYDVPSGETPGNVAGKIPKVGDIQWCQSQRKR